MESKQQLADRLSLEAELKLAEIGRIANDQMNEASRRSEAERLDLEFDAIRDKLLQLEREGVTPDFKQSFFKV